MSKFEVGDVVTFSTGKESEETMEAIVRWLSKQTFTGIVREVDDSSISGLREDAFSDEFVEGLRFYVVQFDPRDTEEFRWATVGSDQLVLATPAQLKAAKGSWGGYGNYGLQNDYQYFEKNWPELVAKVDTQVARRNGAERWVRLTGEDIDKLVPYDAGETVVQQYHIKVTYTDKYRGWRETDNNSEPFYEGEHDVTVAQWLPNDNGYVYRKGLVTVAFGRDEIVPYNGYKGPQDFYDRATGTLTLQYVTKWHLKGNGELKYESKSDNPFVMELYRQNPEWRGAGTIQS
jgi:hypothetical protein